jgi:hypothetical protein
MRPPLALLLLVAAGCAATTPAAVHPTAPVPVLARVFRDPFSGRAFLVLADPVPDPDTRTWATIAPPDAPMMYVMPVDTAAAPPLDAPLTFTLVGPSGAVVVESDRRIFLRGGWASAVTALEIDPAALPDARLAIAGAEPDARWLAIEWTDVPSTLAARWLARRGYRLHPTWDGEPAVFAGRVPETDLQVVSVWREGHDREETLVLRDGDERSWHAGSIDAALALGERRLLVEAMPDGYLFATVE